mmetsp:Transcript_22024/g.37152  ORF Transcript_22024/g.37152 Transcript_22024/m.37152 type:complete len:248 (-) Transcript_22024:135-878(-)
MMKLAGLAISTLLCIARSQNTVEDEPVRAFRHPLTDMPPPSEDVETAPYFPQQQDLKFPIGETVSALCHFSNDGASYYNITAIMGSLNSPFDFRHHFQNYTYKPFGTLVKAGEEITFKYAFQLHPELEPVDYQLAITVFYETEQMSYSSTFFNQTVEMYYPTSEYDLETITSVLFSLALSVVMALITAFACFPDTKIPIVSELFSQASKLEQANIRSLSQTADPEEDWLQDQPGSEATGGNKKKKKN